VVKFFKRHDCQCNFIYIHCPNFSEMFQAFFASQTPLQLSFENCSRHLSPFFSQLTLISRCSSLLGKVRMKCLLRAVTRRLLGVSMSLPEPDNYQIKKNRTVGAGQTGGSQGGGIRPGRLNRLKKHRFSRFEVSCCCGRKTSCERERVSQ
jgi:hypothetical protein